MNERRTNLDFSTFIATWWFTNFRVIIALELVITELINSISLPAVHLLTETTVRYCSSKKGWYLYLIHWCGEQKFDLTYSKRIAITLSSSWFREASRLYFKRRGLLSAIENRRLSLCHTIPACVSDVSIKGGLWWAPNVLLWASRSLNERMRLW